MFMVKKIDKKIDKKIEKEFQEFLDYMKAERNASNATITNYTTDFKIFLDFLIKNNMPTNTNELDTPHMRKYTAFLKTEKKYANATIRRKINSLKSFFNFLVSQDYIIKNPMRAITAPKKEKTLPKFFTEEQIKLLFQVAKESKEDFALRDYMFIKLIANTGMRRSEAINLNFDDIDFGKNTIKIRGKGKRERIVPINKDFSDELFMYFQSRLPLKNKAVFINQAGNRINAAKAQKIFVNLLKKCGLDGQGLTIHSLRHSYATILVNKGSDIVQVQKLLGHSDINTTTVYTHISTENLREDVARLPY